MRIMDVLLAFPAILLALLIVAIAGPGTLHQRSPPSASSTRRSSRASCAARRCRSSRAISSRPPAPSAARERYILTRHLLLNLVAPLTVQVTLALAWALLTEASLSFLGLGTQPPAPSLGVMLSDSRNLMQHAPWLMIFPGLTIMLGILGFNLFGDALRDILDPRTQGAQRMSTLLSTSRISMSASAATRTPTKWCTGVSFDARRRRNARHRRRERLGQIGHRARRSTGWSISAAAASPAGSITLQPRRRQHRSTSPSADEAAADRIARPRDRHDLSGADDLAQPGAHDRRADRGSLPPQSRPAPARRRRRRPRKRSSACASPTPRSGCATIRTSCRAACASA